MNITPPNGSHEPYYGLVYTGHDNIISNVSAYLAVGLIMLIGTMVIIGLVAISAGIADYLDRRSDKVVDKYPSIKAVGRI